MWPPAPALGALDRRSSRPRFLSPPDSLPAELLLWNGARRGEADWSQTFVSPRGPNVTCDATAPLALSECVGA